MIIMYHIILVHVNRQTDRQHTYPSYAPLTILLSSNLIHLTSSSCPSSNRKQAPHSISQILQNTYNKQYNIKALLSNIGYMCYQIQLIQSLYINKHVHLCLLHTKQHVHLESPVKHRPPICSL